jgi:hypothetical protein
LRFLLRMAGADFGEIAVVRTAREVAHEVLFATMDHGSAM